MKPKITIKDLILYIDNIIQENNTPVVNGMLLNPNEVYTDYQLNSSEQYLLLYGDEQYKEMEFIYDTSIHLLRHYHYPLFLLQENNQTKLFRIVGVDPTPYFFKEFIVVFDPLYNIQYNWFANAYKNNREKLNKTLKEICVAKVILNNKGDKNENYIK